MTKKNNRNLVILLASDLSYSGGGRETWISNFVNSNLILNAYEKIDIICIGKEPKNPIFFDRKICVHRCLPSRISSFAKFVLFSMTTLKKILEKGGYEQADVISCGSWSESIAAYFSLRFIRKNKNVVSICWIRSIAIKELKRIYPKFILPICGVIECMLLKKHDIIIANGRDTKEYYENLGISSFVINNAIHLEKFKRANFSEPKFLYCGRLSIEKGVKELTTAIKSLSSRNVKFSKIDFVGGGPELKNAQTMLEHIPQVSFKGCVSQEEIPLALSHYNVSFHLTLSGDLGGGGVSHSILESLASGHLIVCWDSAIYRQINGHEKFFLIPEGDIKTLSDTIELLSSSNPSEKLVEHSLKSAKSYSFDVHLKKYLNIMGLE